jgi:hypothetical protein
MAGKSTGKVIAWWVEPLVLLPFPIGRKVIGIISVAHNDKNERKLRDQSEPLYGD